jgi:ribose 5-phosphate isomerase
VTTDTHSKLDVAIDGADDPNLTWVKGGGALSSEKIAGNLPPVYRYR